MTLPKRKINAAVDDLMFGVRIGDAAKRADADISFAHWPPDGAPPDLLIVDLNLKSARPLDLIGERKGQTRIVAFGSHVDVETLRAAQAAGADKVLPRSAFVRQLDEILRQG